MPDPIKRKRGRPKGSKNKPKTPEVSVAPKVIEPPKPVEPPVEQPKSEKPKPVAPTPKPAPVDPEQQKLIDKHNAEFQKKIDAALKDATPENVVQKLFDALGSSSVDW